MGLVRSSVKSRAKFDIMNIDPQKDIDKAFVPALFIAAKGDDFINPKHSEDLHEKYVGDKNLIKVAGNHNSPRPQYVENSIAIFFTNTLLLKA